MDEDYYNSEEWELERAGVLEDWDGLCENCGDPTDSPHVHHKYGLNHAIYEVLCPDCHADHHGREEIASYQKDSPNCKRCGKSCEWEEINGKWKLIDGKGRLHICKDMKEEVLEISRRIDKATKKIKPLF